MVDVDPNLRGTNREQSGAKPILNCGVARDRFIEIKKQMGRVFHCHTPRELGLEGNAMLFEPRHYGLSLFRSEDADKNMRALQIGVDVNVIDGDKRAFETNFARNDSTQFPFYDFVDPQHAMFHVTLSFPSKFLGHSLELIAFDDIAHLVFTEIAKLNTAFQSGADLFHVILETAERRKSAVVNRLTFSNYPRASGPRNSAVRDQTTCHDAFAQLEDLFHFGVTENRFAELRIE